MSHTRCFVALCFISQAACHLATPPDRPLRSVARSESALEQRIAKDAHVPDDAEVHIHRMELDGHAPEEVIVEVRCDPLTTCTLGEISYEDDDHRVEVRPAHAAFYVYNMAVDKHVVPYVTEPLLAFGHARVGKGKQSSEGVPRDLIITSYAHATSFHTDGSTYESVNTYMSTYEYEDTAYKRTRIDPILGFEINSFEISSIAYLDDFVPHPYIYKRVKSYDWKHVQDECAEHDFCPFAEESSALSTLGSFLRDTQRPAHELGLLMQTMSEAHSQHHPSIWSHPFAWTVFDMAQNRLMSAYDDLSHRGFHPPAIDSTQSSVPRQTRDESIESYDMLLIHRGLFWPRSERVHEWARRRLRRARSKDEVMLMLNLWRKSLPEERREVATLAAYEEALESILSEELHEDPLSVFEAKHLLSLTAEDCRYRSTSCYGRRTPYKPECMRPRQHVTRHFLSRTLAVSPPHFQGYLNDDTWRRDAIYVLAHANDAPVGREIVEALLNNPTGLDAVDSKHTKLLAMLSAQISTDMLEPVSDATFLQMFENWLELFNETELPQLYEADKTWVATVESTLLTLTREYARRIDLRDATTTREELPSLFVSGFYGVMFHIIPKDKHHEWERREVFPTLAHMSDEEFSNHLYRECANFTGFYISGLELHATRTTLQERFTHITLLLEANRHRQIQTGACIRLKEQYARHARQDIPLLEHIVRLAESY